MNRRRLLVALAVLLLLAIFGAAKIAASWRPVAVVRLFPAGTSGFWTPLAVSSRYVSAGENALFDLNTGERVARARVFDYRGTFVGETLEPTGGLWSLPQSGAPRVQLRDGARRFDLPLPRALLLDDLRNYLLRAPHQASQGATWRAQGRFDLLGEGVYLRWRAGRLERDLSYLVADDGPATLTRDGETIVIAGSSGFSFLSARTGKLQRRVVFTKFKPYGWVEISPYGSHALYDVTGSGGLQSRWRVVEAQSGRVAWEFVAHSHNRALFVPDADAVAVPVSARKQWEIRALSDGHLIRTLALVPGEPAAAFSPDGKTLYALADGVLYRQRAR